jgi:hypothetical protein
LDYLGENWTQSIVTFVPNTAEISQNGLSSELNLILGQQELEKTNAAISKQQDNDKDNNKDNTNKARSPLAGQQGKQHLSLGHLNTNDSPNRNRAASWASRASSAGTAGPIITHTFIPVEKLIFKDAKLRTFICEDMMRDRIASNAYELTPGIVKKGKTSIIVVDDSIVRGTTLKMSMVPRLAGLQPKEIIFVSSAPQIRFPDCYGIDMSRLDNLVAFRAAVALLRDRGMEDVLHEVYEKCLATLKNLPDEVKREWMAVDRGMGVNNADGGKNDDGITGGGNSGSSGASGWFGESETSKGSGNKNATEKSETAEDSEGAEKANTTAKNADDKSENTKNADDMNWKFGVNFPVTNWVKKIYDCFTDQEISDKIAELVTDERVKKTNVKVRGKLNER